MRLDIPDYGDIKDLIKRGEQVAALDLVLKLREACVATREELQGANDRVRALEEQVQLKAKISFKDNVCWLEGDPNPICPLCWEDARKPVHLQGPYQQSRGGVAYDCKKHDKIFHTRFSHESACSDPPGDSIAFFDTSNC